MNDSPVDCQSRAVTEPQRDKACPYEVVRVRCVGFFFAYLTRGGKSAIVGEVKGFDEEKRRILDRTERERLV